jgi:hypothetical protein
MIVSAFTGLVTEAVKKIMDELKIKYYSNVLACIVSVLLSAGLGIAYVLITDAAFTKPTIVYIAALAFISWLCATHGYDTVIGQFKNIKKDDDI